MEPPASALTFPTPIAACIAAWTRPQSDPLYRLLHLIQTFEAVLQYSAILAVQNFYAAGLAPNAPTVDRAIRQAISRPALGHWRAFLRDTLAAFARQREGLLSPELYLFYYRPSGKPQPWFTGEGACDRLLALRNKNPGAHGVMAAIRDDEESRRFRDDLQDLVAAHEGPLGEILAAADFLARLPLYAALGRDEAGGGRAITLMGVADPARAPEPVPGSEPYAGHVVVHNPESGRFLDLHPLLLFEACQKPVRPAEASVHGSQVCGRRKVFFHNELEDRTHVLFVELGTAHVSGYSQPPFKLPGEFLSRFPRPGRDEGSGVGANWFDGLIESATRHFVGREEALARVTVHARSETRRALIVVAPPGFGKTTLLARWAETRDADQPGGEAPEPRVHVLRHFIQEGDPATCEAWRVLDNLRRQLCWRFGLDPALPPRDDPSEEAWHQRLLLAQLERVALRDEAPTVVLLVDGLDEAARALGGTGEERSILRWLPSADALPGATRLVLSTRPDLGDDPVFQARFGRDRAEYLELGGLTPENALDLLSPVLSPYEALEQREYVRAIGARSAWNPIYLRFLRHELEDGELTLGRIDQLQAGADLPEGVQAYYGRILQQIERREPAALRLVCLVGVARGPLDLGAAQVILGLDPDQIERAYRVARSVIALDHEGQCTLFAAEFRAYLLGAPGPGLAAVLRLPAALADARARLLAWCGAWSSHRHLYAARCYADHLEEASRPAAVAELARDPAFLAFQAGAFPAEPDAPLRTIQAALRLSVAADDAAGMAEMLLHHAWYVVGATRESPLDALRAGSLVRARAGRHRAANPAAPLVPHPRVGAARS